MLRGFRDFPTTQHFGTRVCCRISQHEGSPYVTFLAILDFIATLAFIGIAALLLFEASSELVKIADFLLLGLLLLFAFLHFLAGIKLRKLDPTGWKLQRIISILWVLAFPVGTALGLYSFYYLMKSGVKLLFSRETREYTTEELERTKTANAKIHLALGTLLLLVAVAAALVIVNPNIPRPARQKRTLAEIRSIGTAVEAYSIDYGTYPAANSLDELARYLEPRYVRKMPREDGWGNEFRYKAWDKDPAIQGLEFYAIGSSGKDGSWEHTDLKSYSNSQTRGFEADIVFSQGKFIRYPEGVQ